MEVAMARLNRAPELPADMPAAWQRLLTAMTQRDPAARPTAPEVSRTLRAFTESEGAEQTVRMAPSAAATTVMPPIATPPPPQTSARVPRRRRPAPVAIVTAVLIIAAVVVGVIIATQRNTATSDTKVHYGTPTLQQPLEHDLRRLETLVHR